MERVALIFDNDGTLVDSLPPHVEFLHRMNSEHQCCLNIPACDDVAGMRRSDVWAIEKVALLKISLFT